MVAKHKRTEKFSIEDYDLLIDCLSQYKRIHVTPNIVTEASSLLRQTYEECSEKLMTILKEMLDKVDENYVTSKKAASCPAFRWAGLTDCSIAAGFGKRIDILTTDFPLYNFLQKSGYRAVNFNNLRPANWGIQT